MIIAISTSSLPMLLLT